MHGEGAQVIGIEICLGVCLLPRSGSVSYDASCFFEKRNLFVLPSACFPAVGLFVVPTRASSWGSLRFPCDAPDKFRRKKLPVHMINR